jgi:flagellar hook-length control protein FliK
MQDAGDATRKQHFEPAIKEGPPREPGFAPVQQGHTEVAQAPVVIRAPAMTQGLETQQFAVSDGGAVVADASLDSEGLILQPGESRGASTSATRLDFTALPRHEQAANVARQLVEISQRASDRAIELSLSPEELGRVKMSLTGTDGAITVSIVAERQETLDLMRRHVDQLAQEFLGIGYTDVNFTFDQQGDSDADPADSFAAAEGESEQTPDTNSVATAPLAVTTGIDVRL